MRHIDDFTIDYFHDSQEAMKLYETIQNLEKDLSITLKIGNNEYFGNINVAAYTVENENEFPSLTALIALHGESTINTLTEKGADFSETSLLGELSFIKNFSKHLATLIWLDSLEEDFALIELGNGVICITKYSDIKNINQEELAKKIVREYAKRHFGAERNYTVKVRTGSLIDF
ncbi:MULTISPECIES: hypothetical protein [Pseudothermotoga]|jgi:hypothetical protein|uniref:Uncharacterized protein n=1 Tax=Pseudothermotoga lettingae (strain ATCC BAA-301 / DSM 14385 / NBRC 107922 / TMO) TaxID=416591 RepID=A8F7T5_PSELT|nr:MULTISPECIES: hypothetical protein [Pseudothermotoga]ABV34219.1 hypothetical protein Tlet_1665 [Pseudothermotoga lettingae TMO]MDI3494490.1 hypothetical protein [Pseudothermotoga sp.]MDK2884824.1 hypothetical protein [Pseudothermotoga sp.]GLI48837.1 hypothetical protein PLETTINGATMO_10060 [Pseudothermotoga lettingae TMO]HBJ81907.1 hypothetical protein [Pseudothermotoga sp.]